jgi:hypothetical protein
MANCMIGFPNRVDAGTLFGGDWLPALPLGQLQKGNLGQVARSTDLLLSSTQFFMDLGSNRKIQLISFRNHNFSIGAKFRLRGYSDAARTILIYESDWSKVWPVIYGLNVLDWKDESWWSRKYTREQREGHMPELIHIMPASKYIRYWHVEFDDVANPAGYIQIGRVFIGPAWQPSINMSHDGASIGWETKTEVQEALSGGESFQRRVPYRVQRFTLNYLDQDEMFTQAFEIQRQGGIDQELLFIFDPDDTIHAIRRRFLARMRTLSPIEFPVGTRNNVAFELKEKI